MLYEEAFKDVTEEENKMNKENDYRQSESYKKQMQEYLCKKQAEQAKLEKIEQNTLAETNTLSEKLPSQPSKEDKIKKCWNKERHESVGYCCYCGLGYN